MRMRPVLARACLAWLAAVLVSSTPAEEGWRPYGFEANEHYRYRLKWTRDGETSTGHYGLHVRPAGDGRLKVEVDGRLGDAECSAAATVDSPEAVPGQMMASCMAMAPALILFWGPAAGYWAGRELADDDGWSFSHGGETMSFRVEGTCTHAGQTGKRAVMRQNGEVRMTACVVASLALPAAVRLDQEDGESMEAVLEAYSR